MFFGQARTVSRSRNFTTSAVARKGMFNLGYSHLVLKLHLLYRPRPGSLPQRTKGVQTFACGEHPVICWTHPYTANITQAKDAHVGVVKQYTMPPTPKAPVLPSDLATELSTYDATEPTSASAPAVKTPSSPEESVTGANAFLSFLEEDLPEEEEAHH